MNKITCMYCENPADWHFDATDNVGWDPLVLCQSCVDKTNLARTRRGIFTPIQNSEKADRIAAIRERMRRLDDPLSPDYLSLLDQILQHDLPWLLNLVEKQGK